MVKPVRNGIIIVWVLLSVQLKAQVATQTGVVSLQKVTASLSAFGKIDSLMENEKLRYQVEYLKQQASVLAQQKLADSLQQLSRQTELGAQQKVQLTLAQDSLQKGKAALQSWMQEAEKKLTDYQQLLVRPYNEKVVAAIKAVAQRRKLLTVQEASGLLYINPAADITEEVIKELR